MRALRYDKLRGALSVAGFGFLSASAWTINLALGLAAIGLSCLLIDYMAERQ